jgi:hypothetical protein
VAEKISKTARASMGKTKPVYVKACPKCLMAMVATKVLTKPRGMYWVCPKCDYHEKI